MKERDHNNMKDTMTKSNDDCSFASSTDSVVNMYDDDEHNISNVVDCSHETKSIHANQLKQGDNSPIIIQNASGCDEKFSLSKLCQLLEEAETSTVDTEGKDVLFLLGATGSGKTTTMLYLVGSSFTKNEFGDYIIQSLPENKPELKRFQISSSSKSCTRHLQMTNLFGRKEASVICDSPALNDTDGYEKEIANGIEIVQALHRARTVLPVLVVNKGWQYDRFVSLTSILQTVIQLTGRTSMDDFLFYRFAFTDCTESDQKEILKKLSDLRREVASRDHPVHSSPMIAILDAMIIDVEIDFLYVDLSKSQDQRLSHFVDSTKIVRNPRQFFKPFVSKNACMTTRLAMKKALDDVETYLSRNAFRQALSVLLQIIQANSMISKYEMRILDEIDIEQTRRKFLDIMGVSQILTLSYDNKESMPDHLKRLNEVTECISLICLSSNDISFVIDHLKSVISPTFEEHSCVNIISKPQEWSWKIARLENVATITKCCSFLDMITNLIHDSVNRIDDEICQEINKVMDICPSTCIESQNDILDYMMQVIQLGKVADAFAAKVIENGPESVKRYKLHHKVKNLRYFIKGNVVMISFAIVDVKMKTSDLTLTKLRSFSDYDLEMVLNSINSMQDLLKKAKVVCSAIISYDLFTDENMDNISRDITQLENRLNSITNIIYKL